MKKTQQKQVSIDNDTCSIGSPAKETAVASEGLPKKKIKKKKNQYGELIVNLAQTKYPVVKKVVKIILGMKIVRDMTSDDWDLYWTDNAVTPEQLGKMKQYQKINHFPGMFTLSRKNYLARNLTKMEKMFPQEYSFFPKTWVLPSQLNQLKKFMDSQTNPVVIAKPEASSQGKGIFLTKNIDDFDYGEHYVVQKYLKKPFIIDGLKFDFRIYVLVAGCDPLRVYIYKEGLSRFATDLYSVPKKQNLKNLFMHLTNYAINKNSDKFQFNNDKNQMDKGHKRSLTAILNMIQSMGHNRQELWSRIKDCIAKTLISAQPILAHHYRSCQPQNYANNMCFEILGFDVILDHHLKPQILEVNYTPSFSTDTPLDLQIKKNLIKQSIILMNLTSKAKNQVIVEKKKQMHERTITGKKLYHTKQSRQALIAKLQQMRDNFESKNLGNFQKILPVDEADTENKNKYEQFLEFSEKCYLETTGANVRRNNKVVVNNPNPLISQNSEVQPNNEGNEQNTEKTPQMIYNQPTKFTNTQDLQKIYKTKFRPMIYRRTGKSQNTIASRNVKRQEEISTSGKYSSKNLRNQKDTLEEMGTDIGNNIYKGSNHVIKTRNVQTIDKTGKTSKQDEGLKMTKLNNRTTGSSMKRGISNIYNLTFQQKTCAQSGGSHLTFK